jgi:hypothetical protein
MSSVQAAEGRVLGPEVERQITRDLIKRSAITFPLFVLFGALGWGLHGVYSVVAATAIVVVNFFLAGAILTWASHKSVSFFAGAFFASFLFRLGLIFAILLFLRDQSWVEMVPLGISLIVQYVVVLVWESSYISASLAFPALKPKKKDYY